jgi:hypothetical protein
MPAPALYGHHSRAAYDTEHQITLKGRVREFAFANPHMQVRFAVKDARGNFVEWTVESASPERLYKAGWTRKTLKPGDEITVTGAPAKDGRKFMSNRLLVTPNGQELHEGAE